MTIGDFWWPFNVFKRDFRILEVFILIKNYFIIFDYLTIYNYSVKIAQSNHLQSYNLRLKSFCKFLTLLMKVRINQHDFN
ncbi:hypothetical protein B5G52_12660 [Pseudoalteromonas sp. A601]|nr:hypothetical protein B5G52_12660 [Pseudoalteromonas sp. A601]